MDRVLARELRALEALVVVTRLGAAFLVAVLLGEDRLGAQGAETQGVGAEAHQVVAGRLVVVAGQEVVARRQARQVEEVEAHRAHLALLHRRTEVVARRRGRLGVVGQVRVVVDPLHHRRQQEAAPLFRSWVHVAMRRISCWTCCIVLLVLRSNLPWRQSEGSVAALM